MRKQIVAGNWKMNTNLQEGIELAIRVNKLAEEAPDEVLVIVAPPFVHLSEVGKVLTRVRLAAQNCSPEPYGAFTGEVSTGMIRSAGASWVIVGHSERRIYFKEDDALLFRKVRAVLDHGMAPIFCCGEQLQEREAGRHKEVVSKQLKDGLFGLEPGDFSKVVIAYEPVWAIGTGVTASPDQAQEMHACIRELAGNQFGEAMAGELSILYGGSCKPSNAEELFSKEDVDGGLIGGASLRAEDFAAIINAVDLQ